MQVSRLVASFCVVVAVMFIARTLAADPPPAEPPRHEEEEEEEEGFFWGRPFSENERMTLGLATCASLVPAVASGISWIYGQPSCGERWLGRRWAPSR